MTKYYVRGKKSERSPDQILSGPYDSAAAASHEAVTHRIDGCVDVRVSVARGRRRSVGRGGARR